MIVGNFSVVVVGNDNDGGGKINFAGICGGRGFGVVVVVVVDCIAMDEAVTKRSIISIKRDDIGDNDCDGDNRNAGPRPRKFPNVVGKFVGERFITNDDGMGKNVGRFVVVVEVGGGGLN